MASEANPQEISINIKGPSELKLQITISTDKTVLELKQAIAAQSNVEADRQRLIYSGRVLKDEDQLSAYKIQTSHTIHMVKGVSRSGGSSSQPSAPQQLPAMQTGQNPHDPLTLLNSHLGFGAMAGLNPFAELGVNPNDPNMIQTMMNSPQFMQQMSSLLSNPEVLDQVIATNPQLAAMGPQVRAAFQSPQFREMLSNPERLQHMMQAASALRQAGINPGAFSGEPMFTPEFLFSTAMGNAGTATGTTASSTTSPSQPQTQPGQTQTSGTTNSGTTTGSTRTPSPFNLFAAASGNRAASAPGATGTGGTQQPGFPFGSMDPALMQQMFGMNPFGGLGGPGAFGGAPAVPTDTRPPEERYETQLRQLQEMGFTNASQNIRALQATGGNVHSAIEYILGGGGLP